MFVRKAGQMPPGNDNLLKEKNVHPITNDIFNKNVNSQSKLVSVSFKYIHTLRLNFPA